jgi:hypothetical protein
MPDGDTPDEFEVEVEQQNLADFSLLRTTAACSDESVMSRDRCDGGDFILSIELGLGDIGAVEAQNP